MQVNTLANLGFAAEQSRFPRDADPPASGHGLGRPTPADHVPGLAHERIHAAKSRRIEDLQENRGRPTLRRVSAAVSGQASRERFDQERERKPLL